MLGRARNTVKLKRLGFFRELRHGDPNGPSLKALLGTKPNYEPDLVIRYLRSGVLRIGSPGVSKDVLDPTGKVIGAPNILTDGTWAWPEDLAYYIERYRIELPQDFTSHLAQNSYRPPTSGEIDLASLEV